MIEDLHGVDDSEKLTAKLPRTIGDAITVTQILDFRYILVDRYCIDQKRIEKMQYEIGKTSLIYTNAELTISAAAGSDPNNGLPGVSHQKR
jgi:hypothetical protein